MTAPFRPFQRSARRLLLAATALLGAALLSPPAALASIIIEPSTWNVIGLDSNAPAFGPYRFPVGAKVCSTANVTDVPVTFHWEAGGTDNGTHIYLRPGSNASMTIPSIAAGSCADAFFEVELNRTAAAFSQTRRYYISAAGVNTPRPREIKVERLVSQSRNAITSIEFGTSLAAMTSVPNGGGFDLVVGNTYYIRMSGYTATQGYEQLESFVNFPNTIFQILSVSSTYSADTSPIVNSPNPGLYADACGWDSDPLSPSYLSCSVSGKAGGQVTVTYQVRILSVGSGRETLNSLIHDFSGSSFHYNADFSTSARFVNLVDPTAVTIAKNFTPDPVVANGISTLTLTLTNPNSGAVDGIGFTDLFPASPAAMTVASPAGNANTCGGVLTDSGGGALGPGDAGVRLAGGILPAYGSCSVKVNVTAPAQGVYTNTTGPLTVAGINIGRTATDTLTIDNTAVPPPPPPPPTCATPVEMARWTMAPTQGTSTPPAYFSKAADVATATAAFSGASNSVTTAAGNPANSWQGTGWSQTEGASTAGSPAYFEFTLDTRKYGGVRMDFDYYMGAGGDWKANNNNHVYVYSRADGGTFSTVLSAAAGNKGNWYSTAANAAASGSSTTTFRINADTAGNASAYVQLDNIVFTGCRAPDPPTITKGFAPAIVAVDGTSTLTFTVVNPNPSTALTGIAFADTLPAGLTVTGGTSAVCGGTLTRTAPDQLSFAGGTLAGGASCTITAVVTAAAPGTHDNISGFVTAAETGANTGPSGTATAQLVALSRPAIAKQFAPDPIFTSAFGGVATLTFTLANPNATQPLSGLAFTDTFPTSPGNMVVANPPNATVSGCGTPTFAPVAGAGSISFSNGTLAAGGTCTVTVDVTAPTAGVYSNTSGNVSHTLNAATWPGNTAGDTLTVEEPALKISLLKQVAAAGAGPWSSYLAVAAGGSVYYRFTVENLGDVPLSNVSVSDPGLPAPLSLASCVWKDGDGITLTAPLTLPVADADDGHLATCTLGPATAIAGSHANTATALASFGVVPLPPDPDGDDTSTATYATSALTLTKSADKSYFLAAGEIINYSYVVSNNGAAVLTGPLTVTVSDNQIATVSCPAVTTIGDLDGDFDPGESLTCTASYTVSAADVVDRQVVNIARATVSGGNITTTYTPQVSKTVPLAPDLRATKSNSVGGNAATSTPFTWTLTVSNAASAGPATFGNGQTLLIDNLPTSGATYSAPAVAANAGGTTGVISCAAAANTLTCTANGPVTIPTGGSFSIAVTTTPTVAGSLVNPPAPGGICRVDPGTAVVELDEANNNCADTVMVTTPAVTLTKSADKSYFVAAGETLTYSYLVKNTGATPIAGPVTVVDDKVAVTCPVVAALNPGAEATCTSAPYSVLVADVTARQVTNTATATLANAGSPISSPQLSLTVPIGPDLSVVKTHPATIPIPGIPFDWTLTVANAATAGYPASYTAGQVLLQDDLPIGPSYNVPATATNSGNTTGTINCAVAAGTLTCTAGDAVSIPPGGGFSIAVATTSASGGTLVNPRSGGICRIDPSLLIAETDEGNNDCGDSVLVGMPSITMLKSVEAYWDPVSLSSKPKAIPGALMLYTLRVTNTGFGPTDSGSVRITDPLPANVDLFVGDLDGPGSGPVRFTDGVVPSGLGYSYGGLADPADKLAFSNDGSNFSYAPNPEPATGFDPSVRSFRVIFDDLTDIFRGTDGTDHPSFTLQFRVRVK